MTILETEALVRRESDSVEFKKSTGQLTRAAETLCAFLNGMAASFWLACRRTRRSLARLSPTGLCETLPSASNGLSPLFTSRFIEFRCRTPVAK